METNRTNKTTVISIVTACYNSEATLRDTFESVLHQSYPHIEYIVVDGGSTDGTLSLIKKYSIKFNGRMRWISERDKGIYDALNKGIALASGEVVGFLHSDDFFTSKNVVERIAAEFHNSDLDAVYGDVHYVSGDNLTRPIRYYSSRNFRRSLLRYGFMPAHPSFYCRTEIYHKYGAFDLSFKVAADFENILRLFHTRGIRTRYIPMDFVTMRTGGASTSGWRSHKQILKDHRNAFKKNNVYSNIFMEFYRYLCRVIEIILFRLSSPQGL
ncbi:MAG: glycosyltransferase family 2 protein [Rikenellaceae bacterium]